MSDVKRLLDEATPLPWVVQQPGDNDPGAGTTFIDTHAYPFGPEPVIAESYPLKAYDAALIVHAVNRLPDYEAAVDALERLVADIFENRGRNTMDDIQIGDHGRILLDAQAALRRLRDEVPA